ncbi:hypothetical protein HHK36_025290 [Tetracentron sinense]|uniref:Uncharacterized protein n=1 Tax=Tetracentron sinense TaxID=13715 RepID=A0A835D525_TETSI|nr:hypothetical protein HHK36_025290 [Tetracentron sinense]
MRGSRARTNFVYSDMPPGSSVTSIISPDEAQQDLSALFVAPQQNDPITQLFFGQDSGNACHFSGGFPAVPSGDAWIPESVSQQPATGFVDGAGSSYQFYDEPELPPLPSCISDVSNVPVSGYDMGQGIWNDSTSFLEVSGQIPIGFDSGPSLGFDSGEFVHSPLFGRMPPISDTFPSVTDGFDLGSSSFFF